LRWISRWRAVRCRSARLASARPATVRDGCADGSGRDETGRGAPACDAARSRGALAAGPAGRGARLPAGGRVRGGGPALSAGRCGGRGGRDGPGRGGRDGPAPGGRPDDEAGPPGRGGRRGPWGGWASDIGVGLQGGERVRRGGRAARTRGTRPAYGPPPGRSGHGHPRSPSPGLVAWPRGPTRPHRPRAGPAPTTSGTGHPPPVAGGTHAPRCRGRRAGRGRSRSGAARFLSRFDRSERQFYDENPPTTVLVTIRPLRAAVLRQEPITPGRPTARANTRTEPSTALASMGSA
jgi:hypothetical protein